MMYTLEVRVEVDDAAVPTERLIAVMADVLDQHEVAPDSAITVVVMADAPIRDLNRTFRQVDAVTDILSFPADAPPPNDDADDPDADSETDPPYLGDLLIAYPYTAHQAADAGHSVGDELVLLVIHGTLHLLGYDHDTPDNQDAMWAEQAAALARAGVPIQVPRFTFDDADS